MAATTGWGTVPAPPDLANVPGLFFDRFGQTGQAAIAKEIAPLVPMRLLKGNYAIDNNGFLGVDLDADPKALTPRAWAGTDRADHRVSFNSKPFELDSWDLGSYLLGDLDVAHLKQTSDIDVEEVIAKHFAIRAEQKHAAKIFQGVAAAGNYAAGHTANVSLGGPTGDIISAFIAYRTRLIDSGLNDTEPTYFLANPEVLGTIRKLDQVRSHFNAPNSNYVDEAALSAILSGIAGIEIRVRAVSHRIKSGGTLSYTMPSTVISLVHAAGGMESSFVKTLHAESAQGLPLLINVETERNIKAVAWEQVGTGLWSAHAADPAAGMLWTAVNVDPAA